MATDLDLAGQLCKKLKNFQHIGQIMETEKPTLICSYLKFKILAKILNALED